MRLKTKITILFTTLIVLYIIFMSLIVAGFSNYYIVNKVSELESYIETNDNYEDVNNYALSLGFVPSPSSNDYIITSENSGVIIFPTEELTNWVINSDSMVEYSYTSNGYTFNVLYQLNPVVVTEFCSIIIILAIISFLVFILMLVVILFFINRNVTKPSKQIINYINKSEEEIIINNNPEFENIYNAIQKYQEQVVVEKENNKELIKTLTHEFKTPYNQILSLIYLYKKQIPGYTDINFVEEKILNLVDENEILINNFLLTYDTNHMKKEIDVSKIVTNLANNYEQIKFNINIEKCIIITNETIFEFIVSNLVSNAVKYHKSYINIYLKSGILIFQNDYKNEVENERGLKIVINLANILHIDCNIIKNDNYVVSLDLTDVTLELPS